MQITGEAPLTAIEKLRMTENFQKWMFEFHHEMSLLGDIGYALTGKRTPIGLALTGKTNTDGEKIFVTIPWTLLEKEPEDVPQFAIDDLKYKIYHEISHLMYSMDDTVTMTDPDTGEEISTKAYVKAIREGIGEPFNVFEDARVERKMFRRLPGTRRYFRRMVEDIKRTKEHQMAEPDVEEAILNTIYLHGGGYYNAKHTKKLRQCKKAVHHWNLIEKAIDILESATTSEGLLDDVRNWVKEAQKQGLFISPPAMPSPQSGGGEPDDKNGEGSGDSKTYIQIQEMVEPENGNGEDSENTETPGSGKSSSGSSNNEDGDEGDEEEPGGQDGNSGEDAEDEENEEENSQGSSGEDEEDDEGEDEDYGNDDEGEEGEEDEEIEDDFTSGHEDDDDEEEAEDFDEEDEEEDDGEFDEEEAEDGEEDEESEEDEEDTGEDEDEESEEEPQEPDDRPKFLEMLKEEMESSDPEEEIPDVIRQDIEDIEKNVNDNKNQWQGYTIVHRPQQYFVEKVQEMQDDFKTPRRMAIEDNTASSVASLKIGLQNAMYDNEFGGEEPGYRRGRGIDNRSLVKVVFGDDRVFTQEMEIEEKSYAVSLIIDLSSSMQGTKVAQAKAALFSCAEVLHQLGIEFEILGFCTDSGLRTLPLDTFKEFGETFSDDIKDVLATQVKTSGYTPEAVALLDAVDRLRYRLENRKLVLIMCDGNPEPDTINQREAIRQIIEENPYIDFCKVLIQTPQRDDDPYQDFVQIGTIEDLPVQLPEKLAEMLLQ